MSNRSYLYISAGQFKKNGEIDKASITFECKNGLAILWGFIFDEKDILNVEFDFENGEKRNIPLFSTDVQTAVKRLSIIRREVALEYGEACNESIDLFTDIAAKSISGHVLLNPIEYYMFGFGDMTDYDVAKSMIESSRNRDWETLNEIVGYENFDSDFKKFAFMGVWY